MDLYIRLNSISTFYIFECRPLASLMPPSTAISSPFMYAAAGLHKKTITPAMSEGSPRRFLGLLSANSSCPPNRSIRPSASFEGKKPGATVFVVIFLGPSSTASCRDRWCAAALETLYMIVPCSPTCGTVVPAIEDTIIMREGETRVPARSRRGAKLMRVSSYITVSTCWYYTYSLARLNTPRTLRSRTF